VVKSLDKWAHQLIETALTENLTLLKGGGNSDKKLMFVAQGCMAIDFMLNALNNYVSSNDRAFLGWLMTVEA